MRLFRILLISLVLWTMATLGARWLVVEEPLPHADALLVLAGAQVYLERLEHAAALFRAGRGERILLTNDGQRGRWSRALQRNPTSIETATAALERAGVPRDRIDVLSGVVRGTSDEAMAMQRYAEGHGIRTLVAVTSPYHSRRTLWTLRRFLGEDGITVGSDPVPMLPTTPKPTTWWASRGGWRTVASEFVKLPYYWVRYGYRSPGQTASAQTKVSGS